MNWFHLAGETICVVWSEPGKYFLVFFYLYFIEMTNRFKEKTTHPQNTHTHDSTNCI